ncbi:MAG: LacI family DNA-binding transcriptional regulator [Armatimonadetes bacterium]|nr:LacI family DNA-binding transcriptional regulator [Armatimonadota bacterium]
MRTTLRDVAAAAGVSAMTVSKVLHGTGTNVRVSQEKADQIRKTASELQYQPNDLARSLRNKRTMTVGVVFRQLTRLNQQNPYFPQLLNGVMAALFEQNYTLALCPKLADLSNNGAVSDGRFDGILWCRPDFTDESIQGLSRSSVPVVMMHTPADLVPGLSTFCADNETAMRRVVQHLVGLGHERVAFVIDEQNEAAAEAKARSEAFLAAMSDFGMQGEICVWNDDATGCVEAYVGTDRPHTAIATFSEAFAGIILRRCVDLGIQVPADLSVVGFDSSTFCETTQPRLTAVNQPVEKMAYEATLHLLNLIQANVEGLPKALPSSSIYDCGLDIRSSTAPPALIVESVS